MAADGTNRRRPTRRPELGARPTWSPDGSETAFVSTREDRRAEDVFAISADRTNVRSLARVPRPDTEPDWSPRRSRIVFRSTRGSTDSVGIPRGAVRHETCTSAAAYPCDTNTFAANGDSTTEVSTGCKTSVTRRLRPSKSRLAQSPHSIDLHPHRRETTGPSWKCLTRRHMR